MCGRFVAIALVLAVSQWSCGSHPASSAVFSDHGAASIADAAAAGDESRVTKLIGDGGDANAVGDKGTSVLQWAMLTQSPRGFEALLAAGADAGHADDNGDTVMHYAAKANDARYLQILLDHHVDPNVTNTLSGRTPLMDALMGDRAPQFEKLIAAGADVSRVDSVGDTVLHLAAQTNKFAQALALLRAGADPAARNAAGLTFQRYLSMTPANVMSAEAISARDTLTAWLTEHNVQLESDQTHVSP